MTLLAAYPDPAARYTGQEDIAVGTPIAGRNRPEIQPLIGFFVNTLVHARRPSTRPGYGALLRRRTSDGRDQSLRAPGHALRNAGGGAGTAARHEPHAALPGDVRAARRAAAGAANAPGLTFSPLQPDTMTAKFDLMLNIVERPDGLRGTLEYNTDLFDASTATRMAGHFQTLLESIVADPDRPITALPLLTGAERQTLLIEWNTTAAAHRHGEHASHERFSHQAARTPDDRGSHGRGQGGREPSRP